ncbi:MAG: NAD(P)-binding domain-containing protein, partial [Proteobacteria bacterium]|nr:NAD(P)-binding domain-containing protein [Pseudomonadota bacterium]
MAELGFIGLGIMGKPMAGHLLKAGHKLYVYDIVPASVAALQKQGAIACASSKEVAEKVDIVLLIVPDTPDVDAALFGKNGIAEGIKAGSIVVDMSSISPIATKEFAKKLKAKGVEMLDAPVSGGQVGAENASLSIMVGGPTEVFEKIKPFFDLMANENVLKVFHAARQDIEIIFHRASIIP